MPPSRYVKLVVFVPLSHADVVRAALAKAGAGTVGNYTGCSFSSRGVGRYCPGKGAKPFIGAVGEFEAVEEERIEVRCSTYEVRDVVTAMKAVHPYEEVAYELYPLMEVV